jgi:gamma-glutamylcyclotransferase (GGCT)/AIG2-like uncharacterized protein YtfP
MSEGGSMTETKFFLYGSMSEGLVHFSRIRDFILKSEPASIKGQAWRLEVGFPVITDEGADEIPGNLVTLNVTELLSSLLEQFHGFNSQEPEKSLYFKKEVMANTQSGPQSTWVFFLNPRYLPVRAQLIPDGDWKQNIAQNPPITETLSDKQKQYILKLSVAKGRESIPCDLASVYRPLMNMELIVDKGRRSALSKLGHEVVRYLG